MGSLWEDSKYVNILTLQISLSDTNKIIVINS